MTKNTTAVDTGKINTEPKSPPPGSGKAKYRYLSPEKLNAVQLARSARRAKVRGHASQEAAYRFELEFRAARAEGLGIVRECRQQVEALLSVGRISREAAVDLQKHLLMATQGLNYRGPGFRAQPIIKQALSTVGAALDKAGSGGFASSQFRDITA